MNKIITDNKGNLIVPNHPVIPFITGDGVGAEITPVTQKILNAAIYKTYAGERSIK